LKDFYEVTGGIVIKSKAVHRTHTLGHKRYNVNPRLDTAQMKAIQLRMARAAVGWGVRELAEKAGVTANTVTRIENGADAKQSTMDRLQGALEAAGVEFIEENGGGPGVRLRKRQRAKISMA
jgi:DNA-binding XRE family transcriptional regulator